MPFQSSPDFISGFLHLFYSRNNVPAGTDRMLQGFLSDFFQFAAFSSGERIVFNCDAISLCYFALEN